MQNNHGDGLTKKFICKKLENNIFKCNYMYDCTDFIEQKELFYYHQKMNKKYNIKLSLSDKVNDSALFDFENDYNNCEEIKFEEISNYLFRQNIKNNFSVKKIDIDFYNHYLDYDEKDIKKYIKNFINNIIKFLSLREINIYISDLLFDSEALNMLIENLSTLKSLDIINIKIYNPEINIAEISSKSFDKMDIKMEKGYVSIFYDNFLNKIKLKNKK